MHRRESSLPIPSKYIDDVKQTKPIWTILSECQSGSTRFRILNKRPYQDCSWVDGRIKPKHKSHRDQKRVGQKCGPLCPNVLKRKRIINVILINPKYKLHARKGKFTIFFLTTLKNLRPLFRTSERSWKFQWNQQCATRIRTSRQDTDAKSCSVKSGRSETRSTERRATLSDKKRKAEESARVSKVCSTKRAKLFACRSRCRSKMPFFTTC